MDDKIIKILKRGGVGVLLTDTLYGLVGRAVDKITVERIYRIKNRKNTKPLIILISSLDDLGFFGIIPDLQAKKLMSSVWPGAVTIIVPCPKNKFEYLHRGTKMLAFRLPSKKSLISLIKETGPLVAPSANPEGFPPAKNITEAKQYFGDTIDFYMYGGKPKESASKIVKINKGKIEIIRK